MSKRAIITALRRAVNGVRAKSQGFGKTVYHATDEVFDTFDNAQLGRETRRNVGSDYDDPDWTFARNLAEVGHWTNSRPMAERLGASREMALRVRGRRQHYQSLKDLDDAINAAGGPAAFREEMRRKGFSGVTVKDEEFGGVSQVTFDPSDIRSVDAAFNPTRRNSANIMAGLAGGVAAPGMAFHGVFGDDDQ